MNEVLFSIILPTFDRSNLIKTAIESVINQDYKNWELIIIDNYSKDNTEELVKNFSDKRIIFIKFKNNGIIAKSRNYGVKLAKGDYIAFLDSDDWWYPQKLKIVNKKIKEGSYKFLYHDMHIKSSKSNLKKKIKYTRKLSNPSYELINFGPAFTTSSVVLDKKVFEEINLFNEEKKFLAWEDFDAWIRFSKVSNSFYFIKEFMGCNLIGKHNTLNILRKKKNLISFKRKYFNNEKISNLPFWYNWSLMIIFFNEGKYKTSFKFCKTLIKKSTISNFFKIFFFYLSSYVLKTVNKSRKINVR